MAALPFADIGGVVRAAFGVIFHCADDADRIGRVGRLKAVAVGG